MKWKHRGEFTRTGNEPTPGAGHDPAETDPRAAEVCPLGLNDGGHAMETIGRDKGGDSYEHVCACGAWTRGYRVTFNDGSKYSVSAAQMQTFIDAGKLRPPPWLVDAVRRRLAPKS